MRIFLVSHSSGLKGPINFLEDYLRQNEHQIMHVEHPLDIYNGKKTILYKNGEIIFSKKRSGDSLLNLVKDFFFSLKYAYQYDYTIYIGGNNFDTLPAILLRLFWLKKIKKIIYFSADFSENRYKNKILNFLYQKIETFVIKYADVTVSNTQRAQQQRLLLGLSIRKSLVIPNGVHLNKEVFKNKHIQKNKFIYIGNVTQEHGISDFIVAMESVIKKLIVIGQGDQWYQLKNYCIKRRIPHDFFYKMDHKRTIDYLQNFDGFGLAPYTSDAGWTKYSSPLKVNEYIACGVPVIISDVPEIALEVKKHNLGIVYHEGNMDTLDKRIKTFNTDNFNKKAEKFYHTYSYNSLYKNLPL
jgi:glycosyltransferase involved in cell wall biosynthesis